VMFSRFQDRKVVLPMRDDRGAMQKAGSLRFAACVDGPREARLVWQMMMC